MMTPKQAVQMYLRDGDKEIVMAEIQRDAREGTVPVEDVQMLIDALTSIASYSEGDHVDSTFDEPVAAGQARMTLLDFRAKHPNLFPK